jgi:ADP-heptose:LPS heptosyltransferase
VADAIRQDGRGLTVLVIRLSALGDVLRTLPPVRLLRSALPRARIVWVVEERCRVAVAGHPDLNDVLVLPRELWRSMLLRPARWRRLARSILDFCRAMRAERPDLVLDFHGNLRSGLTGWASGAPVRLGYQGHQQKEGNRWFTTHRRESGSRRASRMDRNLELIRALGIADRPLPPAEPPLATAGEQDASRIVGDLGSTAFAIVNPGASRAQAHKKPPAALLAAACRRLAERDVLPLVVWGPGERAEAQAIVEAKGGAGRMAPPTDLPTLAALLGRARIFVGGDSGPLHLACATGCPVVALYGPTDPEVNRPWGVPFRAIFPSGRLYTGIKRRDRRAGFEGLSSEAVEAAVDELLDIVPDRKRDSTPPAERV